MAPTFARNLRRNQTHCERKLWHALRDRRKDCKFRRQQPIGPYIADFVCFDAKLIVELDGSRHALAEQQAIDRRRAEYLESRGFRVIRFWNAEVLNNFEGVLEAIFVALTNPSPAVRQV